MPWRHPNERPENRALYKIDERIWREAAARYARGVLVDVGCGKKPMTSLFAPYVDRHIGVDRADSPHGDAVIDVIADAYNIPLDDSSADTVILAQVLEHLEEPKAALIEANRLLRPGGHVLVTTPFFWHIHEAPRDFYRYSPYGLRYLLEAADFEVMEITPTTGVWLMLALEASYALKAWRLGLLEKPSLAAMALLQRIGTWGDRLNWQPNFSTSHLAVGRRA